jgi:hypothetical protein
MNQSDLNLYNSIYNLQHSPSVKNWELSELMLSGMPHDAFTDGFKKDLDNFAKINQLGFNTDTNRSQVDNDLFGKYKTYQYDYTRDAVSIYKDAVRDMTTMNDYTDIIKSLKNNDSAFDNLPMGRTLELATVDAVNIQASKLGLIDYQMSWQSKFSNHFDKGDYESSLQDILDKIGNDGSQVINKIVNGGGRIAGGFIDGLFSNPETVIIAGIVIAILILK